MKPIKLKITIKLITPLHIGGEPGEDTNISYILRGADGKAYYPGTAFKGKVRHHALQLQEERCHFPDSCKCKVCRLFGGEGNAQGSLIFSNLYAVGEQETDLRVGNSIDRFRRVAEDEKLFTTEVAAISAVVGYITGNVDDRCLTLLENSIKFIRQIGGNSSRGLGWIDGDIMVSNEPIDPIEQIDSGTDNALEKCVRVTITPKSPLLIGTHTTQSNFRDSQCTIPGAVMRSALAKAICEQDKTATPTSAGRIRWVAPITGETFFPNLRSVFSDLRFSALNANLQPEPHPITTRKCKLNEEKHDKVDILYLLLSKAWKSGKITEKCQHPECEGRLEKVDPYEDIEEQMLTVTSTHSEMDKWRGTSRDERLHTIRAIAPSTSENSIAFQGTISGNFDMKELSILQESPLYVGAMLTSGFGECEVKFEAVSDTLTSDLSIKKNELSARIKKFNTLVGRNETYVPITLVSDAFVDLKEPDDGNYTKAYEDIVKPFKLERVITKTRVWRGFDTSEPREVAKPTKFLLQAGSVLVVRVNTLDDTLLENLLRIECEGIGDETHVGYGAVRVAHENHIKNVAGKGNKCNG